MSTEEGSTLPRTFLVLARVGDNSLHAQWIDDDSKPRNWDLQLNSYAKDAALSRDYDLPTIFDYGTKWDSIARHFRAYPELLDQYEYVMLPDDDLLMKQGDIDRLFEIAKDNDLTMAQPAMAVESYMSHPIVLQTPGFQLRYSTFLESMACCIKSDYLRSLLPMFERHITGWGTDLVWALLMEDPPYRAAIVDEVPMIHTRPLYSGPMYAGYAAERIDPQAEIDAMLGAVDNHPHAMIVYGARLSGGKTVGPTRARLVNALGLFRIAGKTKRPGLCVRMGLGLIIRAFTMRSYRPEQLRAAAGSDLAEMGIGAPPRSS